MLALDIDNAVALRLLQFDTELMRQNAKLTAFEVCNMMFGSEGKTNDYDAEVQ